MQSIFSQCIALMTILIAMSFSGCSTGTLRDVTSETGGTSTDILYEEALTNLAMIKFYSDQKVLPASYEIVGGNVAVNDTAGGMTGSTYASGNHLFTPSLTLSGQRVFQKTWNVTTQDNIDCLNRLKIIYYDYAEGKYANYASSKLLSKKASKTTTDETKTIKDASGKIISTTSTIWEVTVTPPPTDDSDGIISYQQNSDGKCPHSNTFLHEELPVAPMAITGKYRGLTVWIDPRDPGAMDMLNDLVSDVLKVMQASDKQQAAQKGAAGGSGSSPASAGGNLTPSSPAPTLL